MRPVEIRPDIFWVGVNDRSTELFEGLWPIHDIGVSYNSYLIRDEKTALVDLSKETFTEDFIEQVAELVDLNKIDYIIINHMEPDHTGVLQRIRKLVPNAVFVGMGKAIEMMKDFYGVTENVKVVKHEEMLSLGKFTLKFLFTPLLHWPETMMTYVGEEKLIFTCDGFGGFGSLNSSIFDDDYEDLSLYEGEMLRYYTNIVAAFNRNVVLALDKVAPYPIEVIAPSHGIIWRKNPQRPIELYKKWTAYGNGEADPGVTVLYGSMYRNTERAMDQVLEEFAKANVPVEVFNVSGVHPSYMLPSLWSKRGLIVACPTYERAMFPSMVHALDIAEIKKVKNKVAAYFGSYAWSGGAKAVFDGYAERLEWDAVGGLEFVGQSKENDIAQIRELVRAVAQKSS
ncbi:MAG TPA: FprA family A-type flavoprotein [Anaerolineaceae bacterium]|nr:FprA family A-type flavoprotein [Anaerolineaceae bacterium]